MPVNGGLILRDAPTLSKTAGTGGKAAAMNAMIAVPSTAPKIALIGVKAGETKALPFAPAAPGFGMAADTGQRALQPPPSITTGMRAIITAMAPTAPECGSWFDKVPPPRRARPFILEKRGENAPGWLRYHPGATKRTGNHSLKARFLIP